MSSAGRMVQGGSTLTQQLAKNLFLSPDRTLERKVQEVLLALWLEHKYSKDQILEMYLNRVYFGSGAYGVEAASRRYFDKSARDVSLREAAILAIRAESAVHLFACQRCGRRQQAGAAGARRHARSGHDRRQGADFRRSQAGQQGCRLLERFGAICRRPGHGRIEAADRQDQGRHHC